MISRLTVKLVLFVLTSVMLSSGAFASEFYWKDSYGRGVGSAVTANCGGNQLDAGLCYTPCKSGYNNYGPVCARSIVDMYGRGVGTVPDYNCGSRDADAGLCYEQCRAGYKGAGPVCWQLPPAGYVDCGAGFAISAEACGFVTSGQVIAATMAVAKVVSAGFADANKISWARLSPGGQAKVGYIAGKLQPLMSKLSPIFDDIATKGGSAVKRLKEIAPEVTQWMAAHSDDMAAVVDLAKKIKAGTSAVIQIQNGPDQWIEWLRLAATVTSLTDPTPASGIISSFAYPVYPPYTYSPPQNVPGIIVDPANLYTVDPAGQLLWYRQTSTGQFAISGRPIGTGWDVFVHLQAVRTPGDGGALYAVAPNGDLLYYEHDSNGVFTVGGRPIGNGWNFKHFMAARKGLIYVVRDNGDLVQYNHDDNFNFGVPQVIGVGWGGFQRLYSGGFGAFFAINNDGLLRYYYHNGSQFTVANLVVGNGWNLPYVAFAGNGTVYGVAEDGQLLFYRLVNNAFINNGIGVPIGFGWGAPGKYGVIAGQH